MGPLSSMNKVYSLSIQQEMQRNIGNESHCRVESTTLVAKGKSFTTNPNFGHAINHPKGKERPQCGKLGHTDKCYKIHGFPPSFKFNNKNPGLSGGSSGLPMINLRT